MDKKLLKTLTTLLLLATTLAAQAIDRKALSEYASSLKGQKKADLKTAVFNLIGNPKTLDYGSGYKHTWWGFYRTDRIGNTMECRNRYSDVKFYFTGDDGNSITGMNIEHSFPRSWWGGKKNKTPKAKKRRHRPTPPLSVRRKGQRAKEQLPDGYRHQRLASP